MVCAGLEALGSSTFVGILAFPNTCDYWFWGKIMLAFWIVIGLSLFFADKKQYIKADMISSLGVSSVATLSVSIALTLLQETLDDGTILKVMPGDIFIIIFVICVVFMSIWLIKK